MISIETVLKGLKCSRDTFSKVFLSAQTMKQLSNPKEFEAVTDSADDIVAFYQALQHSQQFGFYELLTLLIKEKSLEDGSISMDLLRSTPPDAVNKAKTEAIVNFASGFENPLETLRGYQRVSRITAKIIIDNVACGSGILVSPDKVLTSWHVVKDLFEKTENGYKVLDSSNSRLQVEFESIKGLVSNANRQYADDTIRYNVVENWCNAFCVCHDEEINDRLPADLTQLKGFWDYAIINLNDVPGSDRDWEKIGNSVVVPKPNEKLFLFQYPGGQGMKVDSSLIITPDPDVPEAVPDLRFVHSVNTVGGSSGGPCFTKTFNFFGLHQGEYLRSPGSSLNRGVPLRRILEHLKDSEIDPDLNSQIVQPLWRMPVDNVFIPIIACDDFNKIIISSINNNDKRIFVVNGGDGLGKTFRLEILKTILPSQSHICLDLGASKISKQSPLELALTIADAIGETDPTFTDVSKALSTGTVWLRDDLLTELITVLEKRRDNKFVWILISDLNKSTIDDKLTGELLMMIYSQAAQFDWLRIVLDSPDILLPTDLAPFIKLCTVGQINLQDLESFFSRYNVGANLKRDLAELHTASSHLYLEYMEEINLGTKAAGKALKRGVERWTQVLQMKFENI